MWLAPVRRRSFHRGPPYPVRAASAGAAARCGLRCEIDERNERMNAKIREGADAARVPYMLVVGDRRRSRAPWRCGVGRIARIWGRFLYRSLWSVCGEVVRGGGEGGQTGSTNHPLIVRLRSTAFHGTS